jgi:hypothetical protein
MLSSFFFLFHSNASLFAGNDAPLPHADMGPSDLCFRSYLLWSVRRVLRRAGLFFFSPRTPASMVRISVRFTNYGSQF